MMHHRHYKLVLPLLAYGDLSQGELHEIEEHLSRCESCRRDLEKIRALHTLLARVPAPEPGEKTFQDARRNARAAIGAERYRPSFLDRLADFLSAGLVFRPAAAAGAGALVAAGFFAGWFVRPAPDERHDGISRGSDMRVTNVRFIGGDRSGSEIDLSYDAVTPVRVRGSMNDPAIQMILARALVEGENAGVRMRAAGSITATRFAPPEPEVRAALLLALKSDENPGVRQEAMRALLRYPGDREIRDALLSALLNDRNPGIRVAAINALDTLQSRGYQPDASQLQTIRQIQQHDQSLFVRVKTQALLEEKQP